MTSNHMREVEIKTRRMRSELPILLIGLALYAASLPCVAFSTDGESSGPLGFDCLSWGFFSLHICWYANVFLLIGWTTFALRRLGFCNWGRRIVVFCGLAASALAAQFLFVDQVNVEFSEKAGEGTRPVTALRAGYWLWLISMIFLLVVGLVTRARVQPGRTDRSGVTRSRVRLTGRSLLRLSKWENLADRA